MKDMSVIVVGAGPVGLLATLRLAQAGIKTTCIEALDGIDDSPRAMVHHPVASKEMERAGVLDDVRKVAMQNRGMCWRISRTGEMIAVLPMQPDEKYPYENLVIGQHLLADVFVDAIKKNDNASILFGKQVTAIDQSSDSDQVTLTIEDNNGQTSTLSASYVVASDGGRSKIRRLLSIPFEGFTYPDQLVSTNVYYPFDKYGWEDGNFMVDPEHWSIIAKINMEGLWRVSYGESNGLTDDEIRERMPWKFSQMFPGPQPLEYKVTKVSPYRLNQRCAATFRKGRVLLAGDSAHLCNPFGGLGLTGGILDAGAVADSLIALFEGRVGEEILDKYSEERRKKFQEVVDPLTQTNKKRLHDDDPETLIERDSFLQMLKNGSNEEKQKIRQLEQMASDMSQFF